MPCLNPSTSTGWNYVLNYVAGRAPPSSEPGAEAIAASSWTLHPNYDDDNVVNDIAIISLSAASAKRPVMLDLSPSSGAASPGRASVALGAATIERRALQISHSSPRELPGPHPKSSLSDPNSAVALPLPVPAGFGSMNADTGTSDYSTTVLPYRLYVRTQTAS